MAVISSKNRKVFKDTQSEQQYRSSDLVHAVFTNDVKKLEQAIQEGGDVNYRKNEDSKTLLQLSIEQGCNMNIIALLLVNRANVAQKGRLGTNALMSAAMCGRGAAARLLLRYDADINSTDDFGNTPLIHAVTYNKRNIAMLLLKHGADMMIRNNDGHTALDVARSSTRDSDTLSMVKVLEKGLKTTVYPNLEKDLLNMTKADIENSKNRKFLEKFHEIGCLGDAFTNIDPCCQASLLMTFLSEITSDEKLFKQIRETMKKTWDAHHRSIQNSVIAKFIDFER